EDHGPLVYLAGSQDPIPFSGRQYLIRSHLPQSEITNSLTAMLIEVNPRINVSFQGFKTMVEDSILRERLLATLSGFFGVLALLLATVGLYGILSFGVASRRNEIGIRMALGATSRNVVSLVLRESIVLVLVGVALGLPLVFALTRFVSTLLFGLTPTDPISLILATVAMFATGILAGSLPARRATKVDPLIALRYE